MWMAAVDMLTDQPQDVPFAMLRALRLVPLLALLTLAACAAPEEPDPTAGRSAEDIYSEARGHLNSGNWQSAIELLEGLEARYPYGDHAQQAQLDIAYAYYKNADHLSAVLAAERFIKLHPRHENVDYAYYLRGLASFDQGSSALQRFFKQNPAARDPKVLREAFDHFDELITRFPDSRYAADAVQRMTHARNLLAEHEILVADYYLRRGAHLAAVNRAQHVLETYPQTGAVPQALEMMVRGYRLLELPDLAEDALRVLAKNHPDRAARLRAEAERITKAPDES